MGSRVSRYALELLVLALLISTPALAQDDRPPGE